MKIKASRLQDRADVAGLVKAGADVVDACRAYLATIYASSAVMRVPKMAGDAGVFAAAIQPRCLAMDDANVYWVNDGFDGGLMRAPKDGGSATAISTDRGPNQYGVVALDNSYVYWAYAGRILRAAK